MLHAIWVSSYIVSFHMHTYIFVYVYNIYVRIKSLHSFPFQPILEELESLLQLVRSTISLDHRAVGDDAGHQACKGRCIISYNMRTPSVRLRHML